MLHVLLSRRRESRDLLKLIDGRAKPWDSAMS
jgi:hypothetical protein